VGQVVGSSTTAGGVTRGFLITPEDTDGNGAPDLWYRDANGDSINDLMLDLGTFGGAQSYAADVNNLGQVIGSATTNNGSWHQFLWQNGSMTDLATQGMLAFDNPEEINDAGQIAGTSPYEGIFLWHDGVRNVVLPGGFAVLNAGGQILYNTTEAR